MIGRPLALLAAGALAAGGALLTLRDGGGEASPPATTAPTTPMDGAALFRAKGCATCHTGPDSTSQVAVGPALVDIAATAGSRIAGTSAEDYVRRSIVDPQAFVVPGFTSPVDMPTLAIGAEELDALVAYLLAAPAG